MTQTQTKSFTVTMGQAFYEELPRVLRAMHGRVTSVNRDATDVHVRVTFPWPTCAETVQDGVWNEFPSCSVGVRAR